MLISVAGSFAGYFLVAFFVAYINASLLSVLHKVTGSCSSLRRVSSAGGCLDRLISLDTPFIPSRVLCVSQPRSSHPLITTFCSHSAASDFVKVQGTKKSNRF